MRAGDPTTVERQAEATVFPEAALQAPRADRAVHRKGETLQAPRLTLRENRPELRRHRRTGLHVYLGPIRPHSLDCDCYNYTQRQALPFC